MTSFWQLMSPKPLPFKVTSVELVPLFGIIEVTSGVLHFQNVKLYEERLLGNGSEEMHFGMPFITPN